MHAQTSHITSSLWRVCFYTIYFNDTPHNCFDSLRIVLHYYLQYEVRFSLSYLKKKSISSPNYYPDYSLSLVSFLVVHIVCVCFITCRICMVSLLEQCHKSSHLRWPLIGTHAVVATLLCYTLQYCYIIHYIQYAIICMLK